MYFLQSALCSAQRTACCKVKNLSNHLFSNFFSKNVAFAKFLPKMCESEFLKLPHSAVWKNERISLTKKIFRQINFLVISLVKKLLSRNFFPKKREREFPQFPHCVMWKLRKFTLTLS